MKDYITIETFTAQRDKQLFSFCQQAQDEERQINAYITKKLGSNYKTIDVYPYKRKKIDCPFKCGNTYVWIKRIYVSTNMYNRILYAKCANTLCEEDFLVYQEISRDK